MVGSCGELMVVVKHIFLGLFFFAISDVWASLVACPAIIMVSFRSWSSQALDKVKERATIGEVALSHNAKRGVKIPTVRRVSTAGHRLGVTDRFPTRDGICGSVPVSGDGPEL